MPLNFHARQGSSFDPDSSVYIVESRILPQTFPDGSAGTEYQYACYRGDERIDGLGVLGRNSVTDVGGARERTFNLEISPAAIVLHILSFKAKLGNTDEDFSFVRDVAQGMVLASSGEASAAYSQRYLATTTAEVLRGAGIVIEGGGASASDGTITLAEVHVPVRVVPAVRR